MDTVSESDYEEEEEEDMSYALATRRAAMLGRLPRISALKIAGCRCTADILTAVQLAGVATRGLRVTELCLCCPEEPVGSVGTALSLAFPRLAKLEFKAGLLAFPLLSAATFPKACLNLHTVSALPGSN